jgi:hypothetical protein
MENKLKYESYKAANNLLNEARKNNDLPRCIAAIAVCESIISDRMQSFLKFKEPEVFIQKGKEKKYIATGIMAKVCLKHFSNYKIEINSKNLGKIESIDLFNDIKSWLSSRNHICHGFVKSESGSHSKQIDEFHKDAFQTAQEGFKLTKLACKWRKQQLQMTNKNK